MYSRFARMPRVPPYFGKVRYDRHVQSLRFPDESDGEFRARAEREGRIARLLVEGCRGNRLVQKLIAEGMWTSERVRRNPTVCVEFEQAIAIGGIGETVAATQSKYWGAGPWIMPLAPDDEFFPERITYFYRENSLYNRRFEQRRRLKELLGQRHRGLVGHAQHRLITKSIFLRDLTQEQTRAIERLLNIAPTDFWRACRGKQFLSLPVRDIQRQLPFDASPAGNVFPTQDGDA